MRRNNMFGVQETIGTIACQARIDGKMIADLAYYFGNAGYLGQASIAGVVKACVESVHRNLKGQGKLDTFDTCNEALDWLRANGFAVGQVQRGRSMQKAVMIESGELAPYRVPQEPERKIDHGIPLVDDNFMARFQETHERLQQEQAQQRSDKSWASVEAALSKPVEVVEVKKDLGEDYTDEMVREIALSMWTGYILKKCELPEAIQKKTVLMERMKPYWVEFKVGGVS